MLKPKIAILIDWYLPGTKAGGPVRSVYSLVQLLKVHYNFYIITSNSDLGTTSAYKNITPNVLFYEDGIHYVYFDSTHIGSGSITSILVEINPNLIYLNSFWSYHFSINIVRQSHKQLLKVPLLLAPRGMLGQGALGLKSLKKQLFLRLAKLTGWYGQITFHATQSQEERDITAQFKKAGIRIASNVNALPVKQNDTKKQKGILKLVYLSRISKVKNTYQALNYLSSIPAEYSISYDIYGNIEDVTYWNECLALIQTLPSHIQVNYKGELPFNTIQQTLQNYHVLLLPTLNENYGHSIVESLLSGCPVIISDQTPWNDLEANNAGYALPLKNPSAFVTAIISFAELDQFSFSEKSKAANNYISKKIDVPSILHQYKALFNDCVKN